MGRKPDYHLGAMNKATGEKNNRAGAAWNNNDGSISVVLNPFVQLTASQDLVLTLFLNDYKTAPVPTKRQDQDDDEIPF